MKHNTRPFGSSVHALLLALRTAGFALALASVLAPAQAADTSPPPAPKPTAPATTSLEAAQAHIKAQRFDAALAELKRLNTKGGANNNADWHNLMGFALRKQATPDLDGAQRHYDQALRIAPQHQGALEYAGELALMKGDLATAERHLSTLKGLCSSPCEPLDDLAKAVAEYRLGRKP